jgi:acyl carrier protein
LGICPSSNHFDIEADQVTDQLNIKDDLNADSISVMEFVLELEDEFGTEISDEDAEKPLCTQKKSINRNVNRLCLIIFYELLTI